MYSEGVGRVICPDNGPVLLGVERPVFSSNVEVEWIRQTDIRGWKGMGGEMVDLDRFFKAKPWKQTNIYPPEN